jgi:circadian clock protein KaiB
MKERIEPSGKEGVYFVDHRLGVADRTPRCLTAYANVKEICEVDTPEKYRITMIDLLKSSDPARSEDITAVPTLIHVPRTPVSQKIIGILTDIKKVLEERYLKGNEETFRTTGRISTSIVQ